MAPPFKTETLESPKEAKISKVSWSFIFSLSEIFCLWEEVTIKMLDFFNSWYQESKTSLVFFPLIFEQIINSFHHLTNFLLELRSIILKLTLFPISVSFPQSRLSILILVIDWKSFHRDPIICKLNFVIMNLEKWWKYLFRSTYLLFRCHSWYIYSDYLWGRVGSWIYHCLTCCTNGYNS